MEYQFSLEMLPSILGDPTFGDRLEKVTYNTLPATPWNYALDLNQDKLDTLHFEEHPVGDVPFSPEGAPISVKVMGIRIDAW